MPTRTASTSSPPHRSSSPTSESSTHNSRRRQRSASCHDSDDDSGRPRKRRTVDLVARAGKHLARTVSINFKPHKILQHGVSVLTLKEVGDIDELPTDDKKFNVFNAILTLLPDARRKLIAEAGDVYLSNTANSIASGLGSARSDDTNSLKKAIIDYIQIDGQDLLDLPPKNNKQRRGFNHHTTGRLLCPPHLDYSDPSVRQQLKDELIHPKPSEYPPFLYENYKIEEDDKFIGLFRSGLLIKAAVHVFIGPSSADNSDPSSRSTRQGNAALNGMTNTTPATIAYIAAQVRFALSSDNIFGQSGRGAFDIYAFYDSVLSILEEPALASDVKDLLSYWNDQLFGVSSCNQSDDENSTAAAILKQRRGL